MDLNAPEDIEDESQIHAERMQRMGHNEVESDLAWAGAYNDDGTLMTLAEARKAGVFDAIEDRTPETVEVGDTKVALTVVQGGTSPDEPHAVPAAVSNPGDEYVCSKLAIMVQVDRWSTPKNGGRSRKTGEWTSDLVPVLAAVEGERPFDVSIQTAIDTIIARIAEEELKAREAQADPSTQP
jgi:hypothetical protein